MTGRRPLDRVFWRKSVYGLLWKRRECFRIVEEGGANDDSLAEDQNLLDDADQRWTQLFRWS